MPKDSELVIKINGEIKGYQNALRAATQKTEALQETFNKIAKTGAVVFAGFSGIAALSTAQFAEFDHQLRSVKTLLDENSFSTKTLDEGFKDLSGGALRALTEFPLALQSINKSLFDTVSAGIPAAQAIQFLGSTSRLAVAGITASAIATDAVTSAVNAYGLSAEDAELVAAKFFTAQKYGKTTVEELSTFFGRAASTAKEFGVSLDELLAATAAMTVGGIKTAAALTALPMLMSNVAKPTKEAAEEAERLGVEFSSTALRAKGLTGFLDDLTNSQKFNTASIEKLFGSIEAQKAVFALTGSQAGKYKQTLDALSDSQQVLTNFSRAYEEQSKSLKNQLTIVTNGLNALAIMVGAKLAPIIRVATGVMKNFFSFLRTYPELADFISRITLTGVVIGGLATTVGLAGMAFLKFQAVMAASAVATGGMTIATKALVGSTALGLLIVFLPEIVELLKGGLGPALIAVGLGLAKTRVAMLAATTSTQGFAIAIKGLVGSTGLGLLIAFLPEITQLIQRFFGDSKNAAKNAADEQKRILLQQAEDEKEITKATLEGRSREEIEFLRRRQELRERIRKAKLIEDDEVYRAEVAGIKLKNELLLKEEAAYNEEQKKARDEQGRESVNANQKIVDMRLQAILDENARIKALNEGKTEEEVAFLKRKQDIQIKALEAEKELDKDRKTALLANVKLLKEQLLKEEEDIVKKQSEIQAKRNEEAEKRRIEEQRQTEERVQALVDENERIDTVFAGREQKEIQFTERKQEIQSQRLEAEAMAAGEERDLALENLRLKENLLLQEEEDFYIKRDELRLAQAEAEAAVEEELNAISTEKRQLLQEAEIDDLIKSFKTKAEIRSKAVKAEVLAKRDENKLFEKEEKEHGFIIAKMRAINRSEEFKNAREAASALSQLQNSENAILKAIGKAGAVSQIIISTQVGMMQAYASMAKYGLVGQGIGLTLALAMAAYGAERSAKVLAAQHGGLVDAQQGGIVAGSGFGDKMPFLLEPGELIAPRQNFEEVVTSVAKQRAVVDEMESDRGEELAPREIIIGLEEDAVDFFTIRQNEQAFLGTSQRIGVVQ